MNPQETIDKLQTQIVELEKLALIGQLTAGILHEIRNPLNFVINFAKLSSELVGDFAEITENLRNSEKTDFADDIDDTANLLKQNLTKISDNGNRALRIITQMLAGTRESNHTTETADINIFVQDFVKLAYQGIRGNDQNFNASINFKFDEKIGHVKFVPQDFSRVIINLANNAFYALNEKLKKNADFSPVLNIETKKIPGKIQISIKDNGCGISDEIKEKIFNAFFSTKPPAVGSGLGLSMSMDIIKNGHKGDLSVESLENQFTEFTITIPDNL
jgi:signal transduction histidine kinase